MDILLKDIEESKNWKTIKLIDKGWSSDKKYYIEDFNGEKFVLRINDIKVFSSKKKEYEIIQKYNNINIPMSIPRGFGICNGGKNVYMLLTWIDGNDLRDVLPELTEAEQYSLGLKAGKILKRIHSIPVEENDRPKKTKISKKMNKLQEYINSKVRIPNDEFVINYIKNNIEDICKEKPVYQHGDFHPGNILYTQNNELGIIDFNRWEVGDPYEEFYKLESFGAEVSIPYCIGQIDGYFNNEVPEKFWKTLSVYVAHSSLFSIKWAEKFGGEQVNGMIKRCYKAFYDYDNFNKIIPSWYDEKLGRKLNGM